MAAPIVIESRLDDPDLERGLKKIRGAFDEIAKAAQRAADDARRSLERIGGPQMLQQFRQSTSALESGLRSAAASARSLGSNLAGLGARLSGISGGLIALGFAAVKSAGEVEKVRRGLQTLDKDRADQTFQRLSQQADKLTVSFTRYAESVIRVRSTQKLTADQSEQLVRGLINISRAVGGTAEAQDRAITALNQILSKGKIMAEELRGQLLEAIPNLAPIIEQRFGTLNAEVLEKKFGTRRFVAGLIEELGKIKQLDPTPLEKFQVSVEKLSGRLAPLGNRILDLLNRNLEPLLNTVDRLLDRFEALPIQTQENIVKFGLFAAATGPLIFGLGQIVGAAGNILGLFRGLGGIIGGSGGLTALLGGLNPAIVGIGAVAAGAIIGIVAFRSEISRLREETQRFKDEAEGVVTFIGKNGELTRVRPGQILGPDGKAVPLISGEVAPGVPINIRSGQDLPLPGDRPGSAAGGGTSTTKRRLTELEQLQKQLREITKETDALANVKSKEFDITVKLGLAEIELARARSQVRAEVERRAGIVTLPEAKEREIKLIDPGPLQEANRELVKIKESVGAIPPPPPRIRTELTEMERLMRGFQDATISAGDAFERFGANIADAFGSVQGLLGNLGRAVKQFFADLVAASLQATVRSALGSIFGGLAGAGADGAIGTPPFNPGASGSGGIFGALGSLFGGGISAPASASGRIIGTPPFNPSAGGFGVGGIFTQSGALAGGGGLFGNLLSGIGFGLKPGSASGSLAAGLPLLGASFGSLAGGSSGLGRILGGAGGAALGVGLTAAPSLLSGTVLAPLFSNPITAIIGGGLLVGGLVAGLVGGAKQRKRDEEASGDMIRQAEEGINQIILAIRNNQIVGLDQARGVFESQVLANFQAQISQLKTKSVRESRLTNTVASLRNNFETRIPPEIEAQQKRLQEEEDRRIRQDDAFRRQIPEFARGGIVPGIDLGFDSVMALARPGEMFLTRGQQSAIRALAGGDVFSRVGVPGSGQQIGSAQAFANGGTVQRVSGQDSDEPIEISLNVTVGMSQSGAEEIAITGMSTNNGRRVIINQINAARLGREL
jgi:tape measure domain-containing protein